MKNTTYLILAFLVCQLSFSKVTVDPVMPSLSNISICDQDSNPQDGMAMCNLTSQNAIILSGQSSLSSSYIISYHSNLSGANSGNSAIASPASYLGSNGQVIYARIVNISTGFFAVGSFQIIINQTPVISNISTSINSGGTFNVIPANALPAGTTYTCTNPVISPIGSLSGGHAETAPVPSISQTLTNVTAATATATYTVTATTPSGCFSTFTITVYVLVPPIISNKSVTICSGTAFVVTPSNILPDVVPTGTTYTWTAPVYSSTNLSFGSAQIFSQTSISQTLINSGNTVETATYTVTANSGNPPLSSSSIFTIVVTVNPKPIISNKTVSICNFGTFYVTPTNIAPEIVPIGTTYTWTLPVITPASSITGGSAQSTPYPTFTQTLTNPTTFTANATYIVTATTPNGCSSTFTITVSITSSFVISNKSVSICNGSTFNVTPTNTLPDVVPVGTTYTWPAPIISPASSIAGGYAQSSPQTSISQTLTNLTTVNATATYTVTATSGAAPNTCSSVFTITVTIKPTVSVTVPSNISICNGSYVPASVFSSNLPGTTYTWTNSNSAIGLGNSGTGNISSFIALNTLNTSISSIITVTPFNNGCLGTPSSYTITVLPSVNLPVFPNVTACSSYTLPPLSVGNYFNGPNGTGGIVAVGTEITTSRTIYIHATNGSCSADESYVVIINPSIVPTFTPISPLCLNSPAPPFQLTSNEGISGTWTPSMIDTTIPGNFVYTFIPDNTITGQECAVQTTVLVTVLPSINPIITGTDNSNIVYVDYPTETVVQPLLLTAMTDVPGDYTYLWYLNGSAIAGATDSTFLINYFAIPDEPRTFSVIVSSVGSGCSGMYSIVVIQAAVPAPSGLTSQTFTPGQTLADLAVIGTNVLWYSSLTGRNTTSTPLPSNTLLVDGTTYYATQTMNGYESPTRLAVTVHSTLSNDSFGFVDFKYSPNPVSDYLFIQAKETIKTVAVYNTLGQLVLSQNGNSMDIKLDLAQLKSGNYFVKIQSDLKQDSFKIIKK